MKRIRGYRTVLFFLCAGLGTGFPIQALGQTSPEDLLLKNYRPRSIYRVPVTRVNKARYPVTDMHSHAYAESPEEVDGWVKTMDEAGIRKTVILTGASGSVFDSLCAVYLRYPGRFELWCGFDLSALDQPDFAEKAVAELERCVARGARGVGELSDKGRGLRRRGSREPGPHPDDPRLDPLFEACARLGLPVNLHVADPIWMYEPMDSTNDGLMNALEWRLDNQPGIVGHAGMIEILARTVARHPKTLFIACHFANLCYDLEQLGRLLDTHPNLFADISARYAETATIPRFVAGFYDRYQDRLLYGTDMGLDLPMYRITFRILESNDEHFYETGQFGYHWSMDGFGLKGGILKKIYMKNAERVLKKN